MHCRHPEPQATEDMHVVNQLLFAAAIGYRSHMSRQRGIDYLKSKLFDAFVRTYGIEMAAELTQRYVALILIRCPITKAGYIQFEEIHMLNQPGNQLDFEI